MTVEIMYFLFFIIGFFSGYSFLEKLIKEISNIYSKKSNSKQKEKIKNKDFESYE